MTVQCFEYCKSVVYCLNIKIDGFNSEYGTELKK